MDAEWHGVMVKIPPGTIVHVWDFEARESATWCIGGNAAEHEFLITSALETDDRGVFLTLVQTGFEREYEIHVHSSKVRVVGDAWLTATE
jgi:hypothetical protein